MENEVRTPNVNDLPTHIDRLDFTPYAKALAGIITAEGTRTPLTIGIFGSWGSGKTSLMLMIKDHLDQKHIPVWFDAWKYEHEQALWRALILRVLARLREEVAPPDVDEEDLTEDQKDLLDTLDDMETSLYRVVEREKLGGVEVDWSEAAKGAGKAAVRIGLNFVPGLESVLGKMLEKAQGAAATDDLDTLFGILQRERQEVYREHVKSLELFQKNFEDVIDEVLPDDDEEGDLQPDERRLVVFIDDLDRCLPEKAIEVLESIKLFMDVEGCLFVLGLDRQVIERGIEIKYRELLPRRGETDREQQQRFGIEGKRYLEKIIQLPFVLPPIEPDVMEDFVKGLIDDWPEGETECARVFARGMGESPRQVKRTINSFLLLWRLAEARGLDQITPVRLAKVVAIQQVARFVYKGLSITPRLLPVLEGYYHDKAAWDAREREDKAADEEQPPEWPTGLSHPTDAVALQRILTLHDAGKSEANFEGLDADDLKPYFTLTQRVQDPVSEEAEMSGSVRLPGLVRIPVGPFTMGTSPEQARRLVKEYGASGDFLEREQPDHTVHLSAYQIGKYPVTNDQYWRFVRDTGREPPGHWDGGAPPEDKSDHPVVYVSWEDAQAYCRWLSAQTGRTVRLPTEAEWEKAARGSDDARLWPWGDDWDPAKCNSAEAGPGDTTPVGQYSPEGDSPYGAADMAGNVWEWCADWFGEDTYENLAGQEVVDPTGPEQGTFRVLRGGAFNNDGNYVRCAFRYRNHPYNRGYNGGFRVVVLPSSLSSDPSGR